MISLNLFDVGKGLVAEVAGGGGIPNPPGYFFIPRIVKQGFLLFPGRGVNSWGWLSRLTLEAAGIAIL